MKKAENLENREKAENQSTKCISRLRRVAPLTQMVTCLCKRGQRRSRLSSSDLESNVVLLKKRIYTKCFPFPFFPFFPFFQKNYKNRGSWKKVLKKGKKGKKGNNEFSRESCLRRLLPPDSNGPKFKQGRPRRSRVSPLR